jgi:hypothetical protein
VSLIVSPHELSARRATLDPMIVVGSVALWLGVYSTVVSTAVALLTLYAEVFLRVSVVTRSGFYGSHQGPAFHERGDEFPATGQTLQPVFGVHVRNRSRQSVYVASVHQARAFAPHRMLEWVAYPHNGPDYVSPNTTVMFIVGGAWTPENTRPRRFFVVDGVGIVHPLRERWRMRAERLTDRSTNLQAKRAALYAHSA